MARFLAYLIGGTLALLILTWGAALGLAVIALIAILLPILWLVVKFYPHTFKDKWRYHYRRRTSTESSSSKGKVIEVEYEIIDEGKKK